MQLSGRLGSVQHPPHTPFFFFFIYNPLIYFFYFFLFFTPLCFGCCGSGRVVIAAFCRPRSGFISLRLALGEQPLPSSSSRARVLPGLQLYCSAYTERSCVAPIYMNNSEPLQTKGRKKKCGSIGTKGDLRELCAP